MKNVKLPMANPEMVALSEHWIVWLALVLLLGNVTEE